MYKNIFILVFFLLYDVLCTPNYIYSNAIAGWYKVHVIPACWREAYRRCHNEGAVLASPLNIEMAAVISSAITKANIDSPIHIGVHSLYADGQFFSIDGVPLEDMYIRWEKDGWLPNEKCMSMKNMDSMYVSSCSARQPYVCYKKQGSYSMTEECGTFDREYHLNNKTGSCYKLHQEHKKWWQAFDICAAEGGYMVIINDEVEAEVIRDMIPSRGKESSQWDRVAIGLRDIFQIRDWRTIHGQEMKDVYHNWAPSQPDNYGGSQYCGNLYRNGGLDDMDCSADLMFVCEKKPTKQIYDSNLTPNVVYS